MSTSNLRLFASRIPKVSLKGVAYVAAANFMARAVILIRNYLVNYFHSEMILLYGATLDTRILLFFQSIYMIPMFLLGVLVFYGIERESFNLVLYPTLMLIFLILIRYGSEAALLVVHWEDHKFDQTPELLFSLLQDVCFITLLLLYVYVSLAFTPIKPTPLELVEGGNVGLQQQQLPSTSQNHGFNYALKRNVGQIPKDYLDKPILDEIPEIPSNSLVVKSEKFGGVVGGPTAGSVIETDLDAVPTPPAAVEVSEPAAKEAVVLVVGADPAIPAVAAVTPPKPKQLKKRAYLMKKASAESADPPKEPEKPTESEKSSESEKPPEPEKMTEAEVDFWSSVNGVIVGETTTKTDGFKTTSV